MTGRSSASRVAPAAVALLLLAVAACGGDEAERGADARAAMEEEFGRRDEPTSEGTGAVPETPAPDAPAAGEDAAGRERGSGTEAAEPVGTRGEPGAAGEDSTPPPAAAPAPEDDRAPGPGNAPAVDVDSLLAAAERAYSALRTLRASFMQRTENRLLERTREGAGRWYQSGRDRFLMDFTDPPEDVYVADGEFLWVYQPSATPGQVIKSELARNAGDTGTADLLGQILREARTSYDGTLAGTETVSGIETRHVALTPRGASRYVQVDVWIATRDALVRRFRIEEENETIRTVTLTDLEPNVPLADSLFRFTPPPGVSVFTP